MAVATLTAPSHLRSLGDIDTRGAKDHKAEWFRGWYQNERLSVLRTTRMAHVGQDCGTGYMWRDTEKSCILLDSASMFR